MPNNELAKNLSLSIKSNDFSSKFLQELNSGNINRVSQNVIALSTVFNMQTNKNETFNAENEEKSYLRHFLIRKMVNLGACDVSRIKMISSSIASSLGNTKQITRESAVSLK